MNPNNQYFLCESPTFSVCLAKIIFANLFYYLTYFTIQFIFATIYDLTALFGTIYEFHCTILVNFYFYLHY